MVDSLPISSPQPLPQSVVPEQPRVILPSASITPAPSPQTVPSVVSEGSDLAERSDPSSQYAGFGVRFLASTVDGMIVGAIYLVLMIPVFILGIITASSGGNRDATATVSVLILFLQGIGSLIAFSYYIYFTAKGQTLGKKALKIRVVRVENGETPGYTKAFLREVVGKLVSAMVFGLGYLWMLWDGKKQTWHDKIAGTVVVKA